MAIRRHAFTHRPIATHVGFLSAIWRKVANAGCRCAQMIVTALLVAGCGGQAYQVEPVDELVLVARAQTQSSGEIRVSATVLGKDETKALFGLGLYEQGIQPVWLEIQNSGAALARYAPVGTDRLYFPPNEIWYTNRGGFSDDARSAMQNRLLDLEMPRYIGAGESRSGFVLTHFREGTKGFNVDVFSNGDAHSFTFFIPVPGFVPDYADLDPSGLYTVDQMSIVDLVGLRQAVTGLPCCTFDSDGASIGMPINFVIVGKSSDVLTALLRANWQEVPKNGTTADEGYFFGRLHDAEFRHSNSGTSDYYTMRVWRAPIDLGETPVAVAQIEHRIDAGSEALRVDPDFDSARFFALQSIWYSQSLQRVAWVRAGDRVSVDSIWSDSQLSAFFTDGYRAVIWLSEEVISSRETETLLWDAPPERMR